MQLMVAFDVLHFRMTRNRLCAICKSKQLANYLYAHQLNPFDLNLRKNNQTNREQTPGIYIHAEHSFSFSFQGFVLKQIEIVGALFIQSIL